MIDFMRGWMINLVTFIMLVTFLEMILPNGGMKRFTNVVIGMLVILVIVNPFIKLLRSDIDIEKEVLNNMFEQSNYNMEGDDKFKDIQEKQVIGVYKEQIINEIKNKLKGEKSYKVEDVSVKIQENIEREDYGHIERIDISVRYYSVKEESDTNTFNENIEVNNIEVKLDSNKIIKCSEDLKDNYLESRYLEDVEEITSNISKHLEVDKQKIFITLKNKKTGGEDSAREN